MKKQKQCNLEDVEKRHAIIKQILAREADNRIHGFSIHPSTVAEMKKLKK